jgi:hypothetical protein
MDRGQYLAARKEWVVTESKTAGGRAPPVPGECAKLRPVKVDDAGGKEARNRPGVGAEVAEYSGGVAVDGCHGADG